jgi:hypothetical protein
MNLQEWRAKKQGERFVLPSGLVVTMRRVGLLDLAAQGEIPTPLVGVVNEWLKKDSWVLDVDGAVKMEPVLDLVAKACVIDPHVEDEPGEVVMGVKELSIMDRLAVFNWAVEVSTAVLPFREEPREPEDTERDREGIQPEAVSNPGD